MAAIANYAATPKIGSATVTTAEAARSGTPTNVVTVFTAGASGSRIDNIDIVGIGTTTSTMVRLWIHTGSAFILWEEIPTQATTPSATIPVQQINLSSVLQNEIFPLVLPTGYSLRATVNDTQTGSGFNIIARGGDF